MKRKRTGSIFGVRLLASVAVVIILLVCLALLSRMGLTQQVGSWSVSVRPVQHWASAFGFMGIELTPGGTEYVVERKNVLMFQFNRPVGYVVDCVALPCRRSQRL